MKSLNRMKIAPLLISIVSVGCGGNVLGTVDTGLTTGKSSQFDQYSG